MKHKCLFFNDDLCPFNWSSTATNCDVFKSVQANRDEYCPYHMTVIKNRQRAIASTKASPLKGVVNFIGKVVRWFIS